MLESKHVIGLFLLMLLFSAVFFTLGYVMGRNQYDGQVRAAASASGHEPVYMPKSDPVPKKTVQTPASTDSDPATSSSNSEWENLGNKKSVDSEPRLQPAPKPSVVPPPSKTVNAKATSRVAPEPVPPAPIRSGRMPAIPSGAAVLQVAALLRQDDALAIANTLQRKHFAAFVQPPQKDKYYRVQVGPFRDQKAAEAAKKGLEGEGFKAFYVKH